MFQNNNVRYDKEFLMIIPIKEYMSKLVGNDEGDDRNVMVMMISIMMIVTMILIMIMIMVMIDKQGKNY